MSYRNEYQKWIASSLLSEAEQTELADLDEEELESRFLGPLEFGTAGLRGVVGVGLNRMNIHVVRHVTQAFAEVILSEDHAGRPPSVAICFDCRIDSEKFAREAACVMAGNGIQARLFDGLRPTPALSFAIRAYGCIAGINITASHNPREYNGYKVYWEDGAQLPLTQAAAVSKKMEEVNFFSGIRHMPYEQALAQGNILFMGEETDALFMGQVMAQTINRKAVAAMADRFKIVFTPFHGAGYRLIPAGLHGLGFRHVICVPEQMEPDGTFPTVKSPNPEEPAGFDLAVRLAQKHGADLIIGSDPDADRIGVMVRDTDGGYVPLSGNQTGVLLLDYLIGARRRAGILPENAATLKTIVTTEMARQIANENGVACFDTFTGFKFMAEKIKEMEETGSHKVIFSFEESYGYMVGDFVRDKDAVTASLLVAEMAAWYAWQGKTLYQGLTDLYERYGWYEERTLSLVMKGLDGLKRMRTLMQALRNSPPREIAGTKVVWVKDYEAGKATQPSSAQTVDMDLRGSNVLRYELEDGTSFMVRPSGTEPKIKIYILASGQSKEQCMARVEQYVAFAKQMGQ